MAQVVATVGEFVTGLAYGLMLAAAWYGLVVSCVVGFLNRGARTGGGRKVWRWHKRAARRVFRGLFERWPDRLAIPVPAWVRPLAAWYRAHRETAAMWTRARGVAQNWQSGAAAHIPELAGSTARPVKADRYGLTLAVTLAPGKTGRNLAEMADQLTSEWRARDGSVEVRRTGVGGHLAAHWILRDPLAQVTAWPGPVSVSVMDPAPVGIHRDGTELLVPLRQHTLIAGVTGAGKTTLQRTLVCALACCADADLRLANNKDSPALRDLRGTVSEYADTDDAAVAMLARAVADMNDRYPLISSGFVPTAGFPAIYVIIDEWARLMRSTSAMNSLRLLTSQGREAWVFAVVATQSPTVDVIGSLSRKQFDNTLGLRLRERANSTVVFGDGALDGGWDLTFGEDAPPGLVLARTRLSPRPKRARSYMVSDAQVARVVVDHPRGAGETADVEPSAGEEDPLLERLGSAGRDGVQTAELVAAGEVLGLSRRTVERRIEQWRADGVAEQAAWGRWRVPAAEPVEEAAP